MRNKEAFITAVIVFVAFGAGIVSLTWDSPTTGLDLLSIVLFIFTGWYATKFKFGKLD